MDAVSGAKHAAPGRHDHEIVGRIDAVHFDRAERIELRNQLPQEREATRQALALIGDVGTIVEPFDREEEVTSIEAEPERRDERGEVGDALSRIAVQHLEAAPMVPVSNMTAPPAPD